jgi:hypothetical protein
MTDEKDRELSNLFSQDVPASRDTGFVDRVSSKLHTRRRVMLAIRIVLLVAVAAVAAPLLPSIITSLLRIFGL